MSNYYGEKIPFIKASETHRLSQSYLKSINAKCIYR